MFIRLVSLILLATGAYCQKTPVTIEKGDLLLRFNPTALLDFNDPAFAVGIERRFSYRWAIAADAGYIMHSYQFYDAKRTSGFLTRPAIRFYPAATSFYIELETHFKQVVYHMEDWVSRETVNGVPSYEQFMSFRYRKRVAGARIKCGRLYRLTRNGRLFAELFAGLGLHHTRYKVLNEPRTTYERGTFTRRTRGSLDIMPAVPLGARLMYLIK